MSSSRTHWKKPATRVYDYNYNLGESYYKPQLRHAELKHHGRVGSPPKARTFAERFVDDPVYGSYGPPNWSRGRQSSLSDDLFGRPTNRQTGIGSGEYTDDSILGGGRSRFNPDGGEFGKPRLSFGERMLEAFGTGGGGRGTSPRVGFADPASPRIQEDPFQDPFFQQRKQAGRGSGIMGEPLTADPDFMSEDPFKSFRAGGRRAFENSSDDTLDEMKRESESIASKFRSKLKAKQKLAQESESDFGEQHHSIFNQSSAPIEQEESTEARIERIRARAKARIAEAMEDDFMPASKSIGRNYLNEDMDLGFGGGNNTGGKSVRIAQRSIKTTYDAE